MKLKKGFRKGLAFIISLCMITTGCSNVSLSTEDTTEITTETTTEAEKEISPVKGGSLRLAMHKPATLNPLKNEDITVDGALKLMFEPLFNINNNMELVPNIAESLSVNGTTVTIRVKNGLSWSDGKAIGADDVIYSLSVIKEASDSSIYKNVLNNIDSFEQTGDKTLNIYYKYPVGAVGYDYVFPIIPKHYYKGSKTADMNPLGSGSFVFGEYTTSKGLKLKSTKGINGEPYIEEIEVMIIDDESTMLDSIENNVIDALSLNSENLGEIKGSITASAKMYTSNQFEYAGFNTRRKIFASADLRQAIVHLMPVDNIIKGIYINNITKSLTPVNPDCVYTDLAGVDSYDNDISTANTLILASGLTKSDFSFKILVNNENSARVETAKMLCDAFNEYGMNTSVEAVSFEEYKNRLSQGSFDMYLGGVELKSNMDLTQLLGSQGSINYTGYQNAKLDEYISKANASADFESYKKALNELNKFISYELPVAGIGFKKKALVCSKRVKGDISPVFSNYYYNIQNWFISQ